MPKSHSDYAKNIPIGILRTYVAANQDNPGLTHEYDAILDQIVNFRKIHLNYAAQYIVREVKKDSGEEVVGTGGTPFMKYLTNHLKTTARMQFKFKYSKVSLARGRLRDMGAHILLSLQFLERWLPNHRIVDVEPQFQGQLRRKTFFFVCIFVGIIYWLFFSR